jgi:hypothetical protein
LGRDLIEFEVTLLRLRVIIFVFVTMCDCELLKAEIASFPQRCSETLQQNHVHSAFDLACFTLIVGWLGRFVWGKYNEFIMELFNLALKLIQDVFEIVYNTIVRFGDRIVAIVPSTEQPIQEQQPQPNTIEEKQEEEEPPPLIDQETVTEEAGFQYCMICGKAMSEFVQMKTFRSGKPLFFCRQCYS